MKIDVKLMDVSDRITQYIENNPIDIYVDYRDELSQEQINDILQGKAEEVRDQIQMDAYGYGEDDMTYYNQNMSDELDIPLEEIEAWFESSDSFYPGYQLTDSDWRRLMSNSTAHITCTMWDVPYNFNGWAYGQPLEYSDVKEALKILGVNPAEFKAIKSGGSATMGDGNFKGYFPNMPNRVPKVNVKDLYDNMIVLYDGVLNFCIGDLENAAECLEGDPKYITFREGTNVVMYDFGGGAGITDVPLTADVTIKRKDLDIRADETIHYGIQECYGFTNAFWNEGSIRHGK